MILFEAKKLELEHHTWFCTNLLEMPERLEQLAQVV
jgi:hypothetical protein